MKYLLDFEIEHDFELIGIASALPGFKIAWHINKILDINLCRVEDHVVTLQLDKNVGELSFEDQETTKRRYSRYIFDIPDKDMYYQLLSFKHQGHPLSAELKGYDYLLKIENPEDMVDEQVLKLQNISVFNYIKKIDVDELELEFLDTF